MATESTQAANIDDHEQLEHTYSISMEDSDSVFTHNDIVNLARPDIMGLRTALSQPADLRDEALTKLLKSRAWKCEEEDFQYQLTFYKEIAFALFNEGRFEEAIEQYKLAIAAVMTDESKAGFLSRDFYNANYIKALKTEPQIYKMAIFFDLVHCCRHIARARIELNEPDRADLEAMDWLQEVEILYECLKYNTVGVHSRLMRSPYLEIPIYRMEACLQYMRHFMYLKNTAMASYCIYRNRCCYGYWFPQDIPEFEFVNVKDMFLLLMLNKHPEPTRVDSWSVEYPQCQLRGMWTKIRAYLNIRRPKKSPDSDAWIWKSRLYVRWGEDERNQLWYLNLKNPTKWQTSTPFPKEFYPIQPSAAKPLVFEDHAWFFSGEEKILRFNLIAETWDSVLTTYRRAWPFNTFNFEINKLCLYSVERYLDKMCVF